MSHAIPKQPASAPRDERRWRALSERRRLPNDPFVYAVTTTRIFCRPGCPSRRPLRSHVRFFATGAQASAAGFRACKRCQPLEAEPLDRVSARIARACRALQRPDPPALSTLARTIGMSTYHFHRVFKTVTGLTPKAYANAHRDDRVRRSLARGADITAALYAAGFHASSRFYEGARARLGMKPSVFRDGGRGERIRFAVGQCSLGAILVAATDVGVCTIALGDDPEALVRELQTRFWAADLVGGDRAFESVVARTVGAIEQPTARWPLPLDIRGTAFQQRVWRALQRIHPGRTLSYSELAQRIGAPRTVRAVAAACAANSLAIAIPCHRVVRRDGTLAGYRWGIERKRALLAREAAASR